MTQQCIHVKARCPVYPRTENTENPIKRFEVPDDKVPWKVAFPKYDPPVYTAPSVAKQPVWADVDVLNKDNKNKTPKWNSLDGKINRKSHEGRYEINSCGCPKNPHGRTGLKGRGLLGRWGPNHAADPIVTRWKRDESGKVVEKDGKKVAQFIAVQRRDNNEWALPGGMVDAGEVITTTIRREFGEEALNTLQATPEEIKQIEQHTNELFAKGTEIYRGYVDDPRNTDNAWMETCAMNFHDQQGDSVAKFKFCAGDDAVGVQWLDLDGSLQLYASHVNFMMETAKKLNASW
ncbi:ADP-ribose pyrophosphatase, mitochondrial-like isoform X2 [Littorina saxatilis]